MKNIAIIYHDADFDGKLSNEVCRFHLERLYPDAAIYSYGWDYGRPVPLPDIGPPDEGTCHPDDPRATAGQIMEWRFWDAIYIVDLSVDELMARPELREKIVWIDHHKSAIEKWDDVQNETETQYVKRPFNGYRIDGVAACRLCWQFFVRDPLSLPRPKSAYVDRMVVEPELIRLAGEYDIWDHRDPDAKVLQFGLRAITSERLKDLVQDEFSKSADGRKSDFLWKAISEGKTIKAYMDRQSDEYSAACARTLEWEGLKFCALNIGQRGNSDLLRGGLKPEHQACFAWRYDGEKVLVSLYHAPGHEDIDLSKIATKYGGGGHRGACGFRVGLTFLTEILCR